MYELTIRTLTEGNEKIKIGSRNFAEELANRYYDCVDIYCVEITNIDTGEILYLKAKG